MGNPLMSMLGMASGTNPMLGQLMNMLMGGSVNPSQMMQQIISNNPEAKKILDSVQQQTQGKSDAEVEKMVRELAKKNGISDDMINSLINKFNK